MSTRMRILGCGRSTQRSGSRCRVAQSSLFASCIHLSVRRWCGQRMTTRYARPRQWPSQAPSPARVHLASAPGCLRAVDLTPPVPPLVSWLSQLGQQDVDEFIKNLVANGQPIVNTPGLGSKSLSSGKVSIAGSPQGVDQNNFDGQRSFTGLGE